MIGPGKYDDILTKARQEAQAQGAVFIVFEGKKGFGFSVQGSPLLTLALPDMLRDMADDIERATLEDVEGAANG